MSSPPKPWERNGAAPAPTPSPTPSPNLLPSAARTTPGATMASASSPAPATTAAAPSTSSANPPSLPARPVGLSTAATAPGAVGPYSAMNRPAYGLGSAYGMGSYGGMGTYSSPYSRFGGYGGGMYGGMGGMGGMGGYGGYGGGFGGMDPNDPNSLSRGMENSTAATFQMIESIVNAFGGFAQMLESTFMATHSSFFAMVRVAEQFGNLRNTLGSILGIFTIVRWAKALVAKVTGRPLPASAGDLTPTSFAQFEGRGGIGMPKPSKKPFFFFIAAVFGLPYLMGKLIRALASRQEEEERRRLLENPATVDPSQLEFCRVTFDFTPEAANGIELEVKKGDLVAVLSKSDPMGNPSQWWRCRARDSRVGYLPSPYLEAIVRRDPSKQITTGQGESRSNTITSEVARDFKDTKPSDIGIESFQKSQFNT